MRAAGEPCEQVRRCERCGLEMQAEAFHEWGSVADGRGACAAVLTCAECGAKKADYAHDFREQSAEETRGQYSGRKRCVQVLRCASCGSTEHRIGVHEYTDGRLPCRRCGLDDNEA